MEKKIYVTPAKLSTFLDKLKNLFATKADVENLNLAKDYEQNDENHSEYIKNRPFYTGDDILNYVRGETFNTASGSWNTYPFLKEGMTYKIIWNGQEYFSTCETVNGNLQIGNATVRTETPDTTKEPYLLQDMAGMLTFIYFIKEESQSYTYEIYESTKNVKVLDKKYIPYVAGEKAEGRIFEYDGNSYKGGVNAEVFNDYVGNVATGSYSHVEGCNNIANHWYTHAEGLGVRASGSVSHSEGAYTVTTGSASHAEGSYTIAAAKDQHVQGTYNIEDTEERYAHIVGNGDYSAKIRSNAHTLDWNGNGWYAGNLYVGGTSQDDAMPLTTVQIIKLEDGD